MGIISIVLIPLFRSFIFTLIKNLKYDEIKVTCFNPFIQVFYFYWWYNVAPSEMTKTVSFNPFIQVFYFYQVQFWQMLD